MDTYIAIISGMTVLAILATGFVLFIMYYQKRIVWQEKELHKKEMKFQEDLIISNTHSVELERKRMARDIHDDLGNIFATLHLQLDSIARDENRQKDLLDQSKKTVQSGIDAVRRISHSIMPNELELFGLQHALASYLDAFGTNGSVSVDYSFSIEENGMPEEMGISVYRITQELVSNTIKHASAKHIQLKIENRTDTYVYSYSDDGIGMSVNDGASMDGMGLKNIQYRCIALHTTPEFYSPPNGGLRCTIIIPKSFK